MNHRGSGVVGYNVQAAVDTEHHLVVAYEVTNVGSDRRQLTRTLPRVSTEMSLHVLAYNMQRMLTLVGTKPLIQAIRA